MPGSPRLKGGGEQGLRVLTEDLPVREERTGTEGVALPAGQLPARRAGCAGTGEILVLPSGVQLARLVPTIPARELPRHSHEEAHLILVLSGRYITSAQRGPSACPEGALIYNAPGTTHRDRFHDLKGEFVTMMIPESLRLQWGDRLDRGARHVGRTGQALASGIATAMMSWQDDDVSLAQVLLDELLAGISGPEDDVRRTPGWMLLAEAYLRDLHDRPADMARLASICDVHPVHLARVFRMRHGCTPVEYSRKLRLERAAAELLRGSDSIAEVASAFGFSDQSHFHRLFKRAYGRSPSLYRRFG